MKSRMTRLSNLTPHDHMASEQASTYTSDITCRNTVFHVELVHNGWIEVTHQHLQRLIRMLVLPVLRQVQSKQVPVEVERQKGHETHTFHTWRKSKTRNTVHHKVFSPAVAVQTSHTVGRTIYSKQRGRKREEQRINENTVKCHCNKLLMRLHILGKISLRKSTSSWKFR